MRRVGRVRGRDRGQREAFILLVPASRTACSFLEKRLARIPELKRPCGTRGNGSARLRGFPQTRPFLRGFYRRLRGKPRVPAFLVILRSPVPRNNASLLAETVALGTYPEVADPLPRNISDLLLEIGSAMTVGSMDSIGQNDNRGKEERSLISVTVFMKV